MSATPGAFYRRFPDPAIAVICFALIQMAPMTPSITLTMPDISLECGGHRSAVPDQPAHIQFVNWSRRMA